MDLRLDGKRALVTGSTAGIGAEIARTLAREGALVAVSGRSERRGREVVAGIEEAGGRAVLALGDVATAEGAALAIAAIDEALGGIDILVNSAAGFVGTSSVSNPLTIPPDDWAGTWALNIGPTIRMIQHFVPGMVERGWGRIVQISSAAAVMPSGETCDYSAAKAGIDNLTLAVARHLAGTGVTCNAVSPGVIYTRAVKYWLRQIGEQQGWGDDEARSARYVTEEIHPQLVKRLGETADIANAVAFIASPLAGYMTGTNVHIDGGAIPTLR